MTDLGFALFLMCVTFLPLLLLLLYGVIREGVTKCPKTGTRHHLFYEVEGFLPPHSCDDYCFHTLERCPCGRERVTGYGMPEVR